MAQLTLQSTLQCIALHLDVCGGSGYAPVLVFIMSSSLWVWYAAVHLMQRAI